jgi:hypothetical protein
LTQSEIFNGTAFVLVIIGCTTQVEMEGYRENTHGLGNTMSKTRQDPPIEQWLVHGE